MTDPAPTTAPSTQPTTEPAAPEEQQGVIIHSDAPAGGLGDYTNSHLDLKGTDANDTISVSNSRDSIITTGKGDDVVRTENLINSTINAASPGRKNITINDGSGNTINTGGNGSLANVNFPDLPGADYNMDNTVHSAGGNSITTVNVNESSRDNQFFGHGGDHVVYKGDNGRDDATVVADSHGYHITTKSASGKDYTVLSVTGDGTGVPSLDIIGKDGKSTNVNTRGLTDPDGTEGSIRPGETMYAPHIMDAIKSAVGPIAHLAQKGQEAGQPAGPDASQQTKNPQQVKSTGAALGQ